MSCLYYDVPCQYQKKVGTFPDTDKCKLCMEIKQRWITLLEPVIRDQLKLIQDNNDMKEKLRSLEITAK